MSLPCGEAARKFFNEKGKTMSIKLPRPVSIYMNSLNSDEISTLEECMARDAHVHDAGEGNHINGLDAIKKWQVSTNEEFNLKSEVTAVEEKYGITIVTSVARGNFPTSPHIFYYFFTIMDDLITNIEIIPGEGNIGS